MHQINEKINYQKIFNLEEYQINENDSVSRIRVKLKKLIIKLNNLIQKKYIYQKIIINKLKEKILKILNISIIINNKKLFFSKINHFLKN